MTGRRGDIARRCARQIGQNEHAITAIGIHGQWIYIDRRHGVAIVKQSSQPVSSDPDTDQFILNAFDAVIDQVTRG